jgi:hypothetical protein
MTLQIDAIEVEAIAIPAPRIEQLTRLSLTGAGVFDVLMQTVKLHLLEEYDAGRITGEEYATVYVNALGNVLQQSVAYLAQLPNEAKVLAEIGLLRQQTVTELMQTDDVIPDKLGFNSGTSLTGLLKAKKDIDAAQADLLDQQEAKLLADTNLTNQKIVTVLS